MVAKKTTKKCNTPLLLFHDLALHDWFSKPVTSAATTLVDVMHFHPHDIDRPIMLLGCGTSDMDDGIIDLGYSDPIHQVDVAANVVSPCLTAGIPPPNKSEANN